MKILVVRPDRLGDVILSTPVLEVLRRHFPKAHLSVMTRRSVASLLKGLPSVDNWIELDLDGRHRGIGGFFRLVKDFQGLQLDTLIVLQSHWKIAFAGFLARIRTRIGPRSKIHSFFFYNQSVRQHRSQVEMHEADYNLQLLSPLGIRIGTRSSVTRVHVDSAVEDQAIGWLREKGWGDPARKWIAVHPGMGGSALNWPFAHYVELIRKLLEDDFAVLVTLGPSDEEVSQQIDKSIQEVFSSNYPLNRLVFFRSSEHPDISFLAALYKQMHAVVAPSTGPLHLAVAVGKPVVTFFPPIRVQSALRWGPYAPDYQPVSVFVPEVFCGEDFKCRGSLCNYYPCMKSLSSKAALEEIKLITRSEVPAPSATESI